MYGYAMKKLMLILPVIAIAVALMVVFQPTKAKVSAAPIPEPSLLTQINQVRAKVNKSPLTEVSFLDQAAHLKDDDLVARHYRWHYYPGEDPDTAWKFIRTVYSGHNPVAENLAWCQTSDSQRVKDWVASPPHYAAMIGDYSQWGTYTEVDPTDGCQVTVNYFLR
jgi:uncharacterized protein YkwD